MLPYPVCIEAGNHSPNNWPHTFLCPCAMICVVSGELWYSACDFGYAVLSVGGHNQRQAIVPRPIAEASICGMPLKRLARNKAKMSAQYQYWALTDRGTSGVRAGTGSKLDHENRMGPERGRT